MIQLDKFAYVVENYESTVSAPSPGVNFWENKRLQLFNVTREDLFEFDPQDFLDLLGVYHDRKKCALIEYHSLEIATIVELKNKGLFLSPSLTWGEGCLCYFVSKDEAHAKYMAKMFTNYVEAGNGATTLFHIKMGLGLGYSRPAVLNFLKRLAIRQSEEA